MAKSFKEVSGVNFSRKEGFSFIFWISLRRKNIHGSFESFDGDSNKPGIFQVFQETLREWKVKKQLGEGERNWVKKLSCGVI